MQKPSNKKSGRSDSKNIERKVFTTYAEVDNWLQERKVKNYTIDPQTLFVSVEGRVELANEKIYYLPLKFKRVNGHFDIHNCHLLSLEGCPNYVQNDFLCNENFLKNLVGGPEFVMGDYDCANNKLVSLLGCAREVQYSFWCDSNLLETLQHAPVVLGKDFSCATNQLTTLEFCPQRVGRDFSCGHNKITSFEHTPQEIRGDFNCEDNLFTSFEYFPKSVGGQIMIEGNQIKSWAHFDASAELGMYVGYMKFEETKDFSKSEYSCEELEIIKEQLKLSQFVNSQNTSTNTKSTFKV